MARAPPRMNIAAPLAPQGSRGPYACARQKRASLVVAAMGLAVSLFALFALAGLWSAQGPAVGRRVHADCVVEYSDSSTVYGRCDQSCDVDDVEGKRNERNKGRMGKNGETEGSGREATAALRSRVVDLGRFKSGTGEPYWVAAVGDSIARNALMAFMGVSGIDMDTVNFERHQDFERLDPASNMRWTLHWAPFPRNATRVVAGWAPDREDKPSGKTPKATRPDAVVVSTSLWHVLWVHDVDAYREDVRRLVQTLGNLGPGIVPVVMNGPFVFGELLEDPGKRTYMVEERVVAYNAALQQAVCSGTDHGYNAHAGAEKRRLKLVDVFSLTARCGAGCSVDGIHSRENVYVERVVPMVLDGFGASR